LAVYPTNTVVAGTQV